MRVPRKGSCWSVLVGAGRCCVKDAGRFSKQHSWCKLAWRLDRGTHSSCLVMCCGAIVVVPCVRAPKLLRCPSLAGETDFVQQIRVLHLRMHPRTEQLLPRPVPIDLLIRLSRHLFGNISPTVVYGRLWLRPNFGHLCGPCLREFESGSEKFRQLLCHRCLWPRGVSWQGNARQRP